MYYPYTTIIFGIKEITIKPSKCPIVTGVLHNNYNEDTCWCDWYSAYLWLMSQCNYYQHSFHFQKQCDLDEKWEVSLKVQENILLIGVFHSVSKNKGGTSHMNVIYNLLAEFLSLGLYSIIQIYYSLVSLGKEEHFCRFSIAEGN